MKTLSSLIFCRILLALLCWAAPGYAAAEDSPHVVFTCWMSPDVPLYEKLNRYYAESFAAIGYSFSMVHQPPMRATDSSLRGTTDGECARVDRYPELVPNLPLVRVEIVLAQTELSVWSHDPQVRASPQTDLSTIAKRTAYVKGTAVMRMVASPEILGMMMEVAGVGQGLRMLAAKRMDYFIVPEALIIEEFTRQDYGDSVHRAGSLMSLNAHPFIHRRHEAILPELTEELRKRFPPEGFILE